MKHLASIKKEEKIIMSNFLDDDIDEEDIEWAELDLNKKEELIAAGNDLTNIDDDVSISDIFSRDDRSSARGRERVTGEKSLLDDDIQNEYLRKFM